MQKGSESEDQRWRIDRPPRVYADESGSTGEDLLSSEQPVFSVGSVHLSTDVAEELLRRAGLIERKDWKFRKLRRSGPGRRAILTILDELDPTTAKFAAAHKRFVAVAKMVDQLLEPILHRVGIDLYDRGGQSLVANLWFHALPMIHSKELVDAFYSSFIRMHMERTIETVDAFYGVLQRLSDEARGEITDDLRLLVQSRADAEALLLGDEAIEPNELDPQISMPITLYDGWGKTLGVPFEAVHDESALLEAWLPRMKPFMFSSMPQRTIGYGERSFTLPLLVTGISFSDSATTPQIQLADIVAGATAYLLSGLAEHPDDERFHRELERRDLLPWLTLAIWPEKDADFDDNDARRPGQRDPATETAEFVKEWESRR